MKLTRERLSESGEQSGVGKHAGSALFAKSVKASQELFFNNFVKSFLATDTTDFSKKRSASIFVRRSPDFGSAYASSRRFFGPSPLQKSSDTPIRSVLNEYTDFTNPDRALLSNQEAEHHGY